MQACLFQPIQDEVVDLVPRPLAIVRGWRIWPRDWFERPVIDIRGSRGPGRQKLPDSEKNGTNQRLHDGSVRAEKLPMSVLLDVRG
jgi:hypothetical protein